MHAGTHCHTRRCIGTDSSSPDVTEASKGWLLAYALDGRGGATSLDPSDEAAVKSALAMATMREPEAPAGIWIHSDFKHPGTHSWLRRVLGRRIAAQTSSWLTEGLCDTQPSCLASPSSDALVLTLRAAQGLPTGLQKNGRNLLAFRIWLTQQVLVTSRESMQGEGVLLVPELERELLQGSGATNCGSLAASILSRTMALSLHAAQEAEDHIALLKERLQLMAMGPLAQKELELLRRELAVGRYNLIKLRRHLLPQKEPLESLMHFCRLPEQKPLQ